MAVTREDAADHAADWFAEQLTDAGIEPTDDPGGLKGAIDAALRLTGTAQGDLATATVDDSDATGFFAVLDYTTLLRLQRAILLRVDLQLDGPQMNKTRSQAVRQIEKAVDDARDAAKPFMTSSNEWGTGVIVGDWLEPVEVA